MLAEAVLALIERIDALLLSPGSMLSIWSLLAAFMIASGFALARRKGRPVRLRVLVRALLPVRRLFGASGRTDMGFTLLSAFGTSVLFGWAVVSHLAIAAYVAAMLGGPPPRVLPEWAAVAVVTFALWLAYEFAYWLDHYLSHRWRWLWAFHKVHHSAETLSPLTVFRVHPVDSLIFYNIAAIVTGLVGGVMRVLVGEVSPWTIGGANVIAVAALLTLKHLHHSHVWIAWGPRFGRFFLSPAHHQIHHSVAPEHHDRNFGDMLGIFDWLAGTLYHPARDREALTFGVQGYADPHSASGALIAPFADALTPPLSPPAAASAVSTR